MKNATHAVFDEAWYLQDSRPPAAQLLYDLGLEHKLSDTFVIDPAISVPAPYPPSAAHKELISNKKARLCPIPLRLSSVPPAIEHASAAKTTREPIGHIFDPLDIAQVYLSPTPYCNAFPKSLVIGKSRMRGQPTAGMAFKEENGRLILLNILASSPAARIPRWRSRIRGAWLIAVNGVTVSTIKEVEALLLDVPREHCPLLFAHSEVQHGLTNDGIPMINSDQLNIRHHLDDHSLMPTGYSVNSFFADSSVSIRVSWIALDEGGVLNQVTRANRLTRGKLMKQDDWTDWESSEFLHSSSR